MEQTVYDHRGNALILTNETLAQTVDSGLGLWYIYLAELKSSVIDRYGYGDVQGYQLGKPPKGVRLSWSPSLSDRACVADSCGVIGCCLFNRETMNKILKAAKIASGITGDDIGWCSEPHCKGTCNQAHR